MEGEEKKVDKEYAAKVFSLVCAVKDCDKKANVIYRGMSLCLGHYNQIVKQEQEMMRKLREQQEKMKKGDDKNVDDRQEKKDNEGNMQGEGSQ